jgi:arylsulfatase A-like enzyme
MFEQELRIPLIVKPAGAPRAGTRHAERLQLLDVMPMILAQLGIAPDEDVQGGLPPEIGHPIYAEAALPVHDSDFQWRVLYAGPLKLHWNAKGYHRLFDLEVDPEERNDLAKRRLLLAQMIKQLAAYRSTLPETASPTAKAPLDAETRQLLESLGYLERDEAAADPKDEAEP